MKAVIMAGGDGKRLRPLSCTMPKPMVPLLNKPVLGYCMELIKKHGFDEDTVRAVALQVKQLVDDGITTKVASIGEESQLKLQDTMQKIFNDSNGCMVCIII